jgi:hypothetical protein
VAESKAVEQAAEELYGLPPGDFTRARDERVKALRKDGDREAAGTVKALRKPTVAAWALNQLVRRRRKDVEALLEAGEELRAAQEELLGGGERSAFQEAAANERELVAKLSADGATLASEAGERGGGLQEKLAATLHAAALDEDIAEELRAGRLVREREAIGGFGGFGAELAIEAPSGDRPTPKAAKASASRAKPAAKKAAPRTKASASAAAKDAERRQRLAAARTDERHARRELESATKTLEHAQERADAAEAHAAEAAERARTTSERLKEAKKAASAARKAHDRAASELQRAERAAGKS